jgi:hypothetical protein
MPEILVKYTIFLTFVWITSKRHLFRAKGSRGLQMNFSAEMTELPGRSILKEKPGFCSR